MIYPWQQSQWQQVTQLVKADRLPHALLLTGNQGLGKSDFAMALASSVLCQHPRDDLQACGKCRSCNLLAAGTYPDLYQITPSAPAGSTSKNPVMSIKIDDIRDLCNSLSQTSQYGGYRVAILEQAECLTISAANSLLKTLEEPGVNTLLMLVSARPHRLPVTIRSRCQSLRFSVPDQQLALDWLQSNNAIQVSVDQLSRALKQSHGSPLSALDCLQETEHLQLLSAAMTAGMSGKSSLEYAEKLTRFPKLRTLEAMLTWACDVSKIQACGATADIVNEQERVKLQVLAERAKPQHLFQFYDQLNFNLLNSSIAVNEQLLWENLLISWDQL